jgi:hypothetical protein
MNRLFRTATIALGLVALATAPLLAEVKTRDRSSFKLEGFAGKVVGMFAGKAAKEGVEGMTAVKGDRKAVINDTTGRIVDLKEEKVYTLDMKKKTYTVKTFDEIRKEMREAEERAKKDAEKEQPAEKPQAEKPQKEYEIDFDVKDTGQKKQVAGYDAHEAIATVTVREKGKTLEEGGGMVMTNDMWLGPQIPQMKEFGDFELRYWQQLQGPEVAAMDAQQMAAVMAMYPMLKGAMERFAKEGGKLQGTALETTSTFEAVKSKEEMAQEAQQSQDSGKSSGGGLGGMLARKMMQKKGGDEPKQRATVMTLHHEILEVSTSVAPTDLSIPADFKEKK